MFEHIENKTTVKEKIRLTERQNQIINFLISGDTYNDIAHKMNVSVNTIRKHISILYKKLNIKNRSSLFKIKMHNLIELN
jgi:DNA-binding NarL/FixJ family response regulator